MRIGIAFRNFHLRSGLPRYCVEIARRIAHLDELYVFARTVEVDIAARGTIRFPWSFHSTTLEYGPNGLVNCALIATAKKVLGLDIAHTQGSDLLGFDVITAHGTWWGHFRSHAASDPLAAVELRKSILPILERANYRGRRYKRIIAVSELGRRELMEAYEVPQDDITVVPDGVDSEQFRPDPARRRAWRNRMGLNGETVLLHVSTDFVRKGLLTIIRALPSMEGNPHLVVVGRDDPAPYQAEARKVGAREVTFLPFAEAIEDCYAGADAFVFPSDYESFGLSLLEAMASGLPVICTRAVGAAELMTDGKDVILLDRSDDPHELAVKVDVALSDGKGIGRAARQTAEQYPWDRTVSQTRDVYEACLRG